MKVVVIGSVTSTERTLLKLIEHHIDVTAVFGYETKNTNLVSGYRNFKKICVDNQIEYYSFEKINDKKNIELLKKIKPNIIFAVGFSQILRDEIVKIPINGVVGFHPTNLPEGRGRAPISWMVLNQKNGAANFFLLGKGVDDGPILIQEKFNFDKNDDAEIVEKKILKSIDIALDKWLPKLKKGKLFSTKQNEKHATEYGRRAPLDGIINWYDSAEKIDRLIKASSKPHPGAFSFFGDAKIIIWKSLYEEQSNLFGVVGRVVKKNGKELLIQTGKGLLWIKEYELIYETSDEQIKKPIVGSRLGYYEQYEIYKLRKEIKKIYKEINELKGNK